MHLVGLQSVKRGAKSLNGDISIYKKLNARSYFPRYIQSTRKIVLQAVDM